MINFAGECVDKMTKNTLNISKTAFWDVDFSKLDFENRSLFVIEKVLNYGLWSDIVEVFRFYGRNRIRQEITQASYLKKTAVSFLCLLLDLKENEFKCYTKTQSNLGHWEH
ncbi:MAG: hypothetical protein Q7T20_07115 [Saprospiraceae bacterium]|nr:hypothetical protein [Saprospiraceae bacterium]